MHRSSLLEKIKTYSPEDVDEMHFRATFLNFINEHTDCFSRELRIGHITGSAWIINKALNKVVLVHHKKLDRWLQPGGHADGITDVVQVATQEAQEETGLKSLKLLSDDIFDLDIHVIPARKSDPEHLHYDVRFIFEADEQEAFVISDESNQLAWVPIDSLHDATENNKSILRMAGKTKRLYKRREDL